MIKDREQKAKALQFAVANRWFPQLELEVGAEAAIGERASAVTDLDVFASIPDHFSGYRSVVFDCKTKAKESAVNRALWLLGIMQRMEAQQGFCILRNSAINVDHRLMTARRGVVLLSEEEFDLYVRATTSSPFPGSNTTSNVQQLELWDTFYERLRRFPKLIGGSLFVRSGYWMIEDAAEACRKTLATMRGLHSELDPAHSSHVALFLDLCALFARSLAVVVCGLFKAYLHPSSQADLSDALLMMLYGGREAYEFRNDIYKMVKTRNGDSQVPDLALPEWERFLRLVRQLLDSPLSVQQTPLILREVAFGMIAEDKTLSFARTLCAESPQAARFALLIPSYLVRAAHLPSDFGTMADNALVSLQPIR
jgi:hypothetical protein